MKESKPKQIIFLILEIALVLFILYQGYQIWDYFNQTRANDRMYEDIQASVGVFRGHPAKGTSAADENQAFRISEADSRQLLAELRKMNPDVVAYLDIPSLDISYPVVQAKSNTYYLTRDFKRAYSVAGSIFVDYRNKGDFSDRNTVIYGHRMKYGGMFHNLKLLREQATFDQGHRLYLTREDGLYIYDIYSAYRVKSDGDYRKMRFANDAQWAAFLKKTARASEAAGGVDPAGADRIITLSTCTTDGHAYRIAVHAVRVSGPEPETP